MSARDHDGKPPAALLERARRQPVRPRVLYPEPRFLERSYGPCPPGGNGGAANRASVLVIVLVTLVFTAFALATFMDKAMNDLLVDHREARAKRLRMEAYSALETTLAVLEDFRLVGNGLKSPGEGWSNPLEFAGYQPADGLRVEVTFDDESGKLSLPRADAAILSRLFQAWEVPQNEADELADALIGWMKKDHIYSSGLNPDYESGELPYEEPGRPLRSYGELAAIEKAREFFYDERGRPNEYWQRFVQDVSLLDFAKTNINAARPDVLAALGQYDPSQVANLTDYRRGQGQFQGRSRTFFGDTNEAALIAGQGGNAAAFTTQISALRVIVTVFEGRSEFRVAAVVTPPGADGAKVVRQTAQRSETTTRAARTGAQQQQAPDARKASPARKQREAKTGENPDLKYPFTLLEIKENDEIPPPPAESAPPV